MAVLIVLLQAPPRQMGDPDGGKDSINVDVIDANDLASFAAPPGADAPPRAEPTPEPAPATPPSVPSPPEPAPEREQNAASPALRPSLQQAAPDPPTARPSGSKASDAATLEKEMLELFALPADPAGKQGKNDRVSKDVLAKESGAKDQAGAPAKPAKDQPSKEQQTGKGKATSLSSLDLSVPRKLLNASPNFSGTSAAMSRPADITRSGENDDFGRGVIRALRTTMPAPNGTTGRTTVRIVLSETGNIVEVRLVNGSGIPQLDQSVLFAAKQASFPAPPKGSTISDRTFLITYVYL